jgi:hypothetical protein
MFLTLGLIKCEYNMKALEKLIENIFVKMNYNSMVRPTNKGKNNMDIIW